MKKVIFTLAISYICQASSKNLSPDDLINFYNKTTQKKIIRVNNKIFYTDDLPDDLKNEMFQTLLVTQRKIHNIFERFAIRYYLAKKYKHKTSQKDLPTLMYLFHANISDQKIKNNSNFKKQKFETKKDQQRYILEEKFKLSAATLQKGYYQTLEIMKKNKAYENFTTAPSIYKFPHLLNKRPSIGQNKAKNYIVGIMNPFCEKCSTQLLNTAKKIKTYSKKLKYVHINITIPNNSKLFSTKRKIDTTFYCINTIYPNKYWPLYIQYINEKKHYSINVKNKNKILKDFLRFIQKNKINIKKILFCEKSKYTQQYFKKMDRWLTEIGILKAPNFFFNKNFILDPNNLQQYINKQLQ